MKNINTRKKKNSSNGKTKKNVKKCIETFVEKKVKYWTDDDTNKEIKKLENKNVTKEEKQLLTKLKKQKKEQINTLKKNLKLYNCNINCKNTLLEPGAPNKIPKAMQKTFGNSKELIKIVTKRRKDIFKDKTNVLIDDFYEKTPDKIKNQLIKEGAISNCIPTTTT
jgi:hypothetical protein